MNNIGPIVGFTCAALLVVGLMAWHFSRGRSLLERWAEENGYAILDGRYRHLLRGPFTWTSSKGQAVYRITIRDAHGNVRSGWLRCGGWWAGMFADKTEVRWDSER